VYDYTANHVLEILGPLYALDTAVPGPVELRILGHQPLPSGDEFAAAVDIVMHDRELRERLRSGELAVYRPMPPVLDRQLPDGRVERTLTVGLRATSAEAQFHEVVGVSMFDRRVLRGELDGVVRPSHHVCEPPPGRDPPVGGGGLSGQCWVTVTSGGQTLWRFDGQGFTTDPNLSRAHIDKFMSPPESVEDTDVVIWYAAHYVHDAGIEVGNRPGSSADFYV
jgi:hypothetical protein